jgi:DNA-binding NarL/FixJ family response regulator
MIARVVGLSARETRRLIEEFTRHRPVAKTELVAALTEREREVLELIASGLSNQELADRLFIADNTVKTNVKRILSNLSARDRAQATVIAHESGLAC